MQSFKLYDYETRGLEPLPLVGHHVYFADGGGAEILMVACGEETGEPWVQDKIGPITAAPVSWGNFDYHCYNQLEAPIALEDWVDAMALASYIGFPEGLNAFCSAIGIENRKDPRGSRLIKLYCIPKEDGTFREMPEEDRLAMEEYALQDLVLLQSAWSLLKPLYLEWREFSWPHYQSVERMNIEGLPIDRENATRALTLVDDYREQKTQEFRELTGFNPSQTEKVRVFLGLENAQKATLAAAKFTPGSDEDTVRNVRLSLNAKAPEKLRHMIRMSRLDGRVRGIWMANGAHTGRMSSRKLQAHNMVRAKIDPDYFSDLEEGNEIANPIESARTNIRGFIQADPGYQLAVADYAQIECRLLAHVSDCEPLLKAFMTPGYDPYKMFAALHFGLDDWRDINDTQRTFGKLGLLGPGYGCGRIGLRRQAPGYGVELSDAESGRLVSSFRTNLPAIPEFWGTLEGGSRDCVIGAGGMELDCGAGGSVEGSFFELRLPSGRRLRYYKPSATPNGWTYLKRLGYGLVRSSYWGGLGTENLIQAIAADVMFDAMIRLQEMGYAVIGSVHDEIIMHVPQADADDALATMLDVMADPPSWVPKGLLLGEGAVTERYTKI